MKTYTKLNRNYRKWKWYKCLIFLYKNGEGYILKMQINLEKIDTEIKDVLCGIKANEELEYSWKISRTIN